ncbi:glycoside hydrolase family 43 protein [Microbacterium excoecariae]|uniref:glycoside hydrolase family 43 protein n=1 Tax=Microbacterium excoecariae TaxID=2715210 RepID=UPI00140B5A53|nr:glycoside hydrolase family 43 protein [Microbacterium excoecariae]NHI15792.1 glycoside hydrolase family 43 protein [Microbacterium excoecariae]
MAAPETPSGYPNPLLPGFNPDPSVVAVDGAYYIVTSTFEYLPGLPVYRSTDFVEWEQIGNVATRPEQLEIAEVPTNLGVWAPTLRFHDGRFFVIVGVPGGRGCIVFTATDPAGPWSDGVVIEGLNGIDPDLAWDEDGTAIITFSGLILSGPETGTHLGIQQVRADLDTGEILTPVRDIWSGSGSMFPEAPHLYRRDGFWYLLIAEGGTERGHGCSIARGPSPEGPFTAFDGNPFLTARSTIRPVQNTGHGDFVTGPSGETLLVMLGVRPRGGTRAFSPLGRETFVTPVRWVDGWPIADPVAHAPRPELRDDVAFDGPLDNRWIAPRRLPAELASVDPAAETLTIRGAGTTLDGLRPAFVGRRQLAIATRAAVTADVSRGIGGLAVRYDEDTHVDIEARVDGDGVIVTARAVVPSLRQEWSARLPAGPVRLHLDSAFPDTDSFGTLAMTSDVITLWAESGGERVELAAVDGRSLSAETAASFTGRVIGLYATSGDVTFRAFSSLGTEAPSPATFGTAA